MSRALAAALVLASGGALARDAAPVTPTRTEAAAYAITHSLLVVNLVKNCDRFGAQLGRDPAAALAGWRQRNGGRVAAAEAYFVFARAASERLGGAAAGEDFHARTHGLSVQQANRTLNDIFGALGPRPAVCKRWIEAIAQGQTDLDWQSKYLPLLDELVEFERKIRSGALPDAR